MSLPRRVDSSYFADDEDFNPEDLPVADMFGHLLVADLHGHSRFAADYAQGGSRRFRLPALDDPEPDEPWGTPHIGLDESELYQREQILDRYRSEGRTELQLRSMRALWVEDLSLRKHAKRERVSPAAIHARIAGSKGSGGVLKACPEFAEFWDRLHARRRGRRRGHGQLQRPTKARFSLDGVTATNTAGFGGASQPLRGDIECQD